MSDYGNLLKRLTRQNTDRLAAELAAAKAELAEANDALRKANAAIDALQKPSAKKAKPTPRRTTVGP